MANKLTREDIVKTAELSRINLSEKEIDKFRKELSSILEYVNVLDEVDTEDTKETSQVTGLKNKLRNDLPAESLSQEDALSNAKRKRNGYFITN